MEKNQLNIKNILQWGLYYRSIGWCILPVETGTKHPNLKGWKQYQQKIPTIDEISKWFSEARHTGMVAVTGSVSGVLVLDVDNGADLTGLELPLTIVAKSGSGGTHYYFKLPPGKIFKNSAGEIGDKIDVRAEGGLIVLPPSIHKTGNKYKWAEGCSPEEIGVENIAEIPKWLLDRLESIKKRENKTPKDWGAIHKGVSEGQRNETAASYIGKILQSTDPNMWEKSGWDAVRFWNERNTPPLDHKELRATWESIKEIRMNQLRGENIDDFKLLYTKDETKKVAAYKIAQFLVQHHHIKTTDEKKRELYIYKDGIYIQGENIIGAEIQRILEEFCSTHGKREIIEKIKDLTLIDRSEFGSEDKLINLENGIYNLQKKELLNHDPDHSFLTKIPVSFNPQADCPRIKKFLNEILDEHSIKIIQEWAGYALYRRYFIKKAIIFVGERDTGKTTLINLLIRFFSPKNISGVSLQRIGADKFATSQLYAKHLNVYDDLSAKDITDNGTFKIATGGGLATGEYKFGNQFQFQNYSKLTFACNKIPHIIDTQDEAFFSRWIVIQFNKQINTPNQFLLDEITTNQELSGFLNLALEGLHRLLETRRISYNKDPIDIKEEMLKSGSPVANFAYDCLKQGDSNDWISKEELYKVFADYASQKELPIATIENFGKKLPSYAEYISNSRRNAVNPNTDKLKQTTGWAGVCLKDSREE